MLGSAGTDGPMKAQPPLEGLTRVRLPVTASAPPGTPEVPPVTWNGRATFVANLPLRPMPVRLSRMRTGSSGVKVEPELSAVK